MSGIYDTGRSGERGAEICRKHSIDGIVVIGGDEALSAAWESFLHLGINTIGLPGTIGPGYCMYGIIPLALIQL